MSRDCDEPGLTRVFASCSLTCYDDPQGLSGVQHLTTTQHLLLATPGREVVLSSSRDVARRDEPHHAWHFLQTGGLGVFEEGGGGNRLLLS